MKRHISIFALMGGLIVLVLGLLAMLNLTNPLSAGVFGVLVMMGLIYGVTWLTLLIVIRLSEIVYGALRSPTKTETAETVVGQEKTRGARKRSTLIAAALSFVPIFIISLNSIGSLSFRDILLITVIQIIAIFYIVKRV
ncbi:hypothetical protein FWG95_02365 [Candidatus Saccharibacteria bacterium]|nr:hypothetical protein [Candidatus Saccharibacteria bacterium]